MQIEKGTYHHGLQWLLLILAALWPALWLFVPYGLSPDGERGFGAGLVDDAYRGFFRVFLHVPHATTLEHPAALLAASVFVITVVAIVLVRLLIRRLDPLVHSLSALRWSARTIPCMVVWCCGLLAALGATAIWMSVSSGWLDNVVWVVTMVVVVLCFLAPIPLCLRRDIVNRDRPPAFWMPRWPGGGVIVVTAVLLALWLSIGAAEKWFEFGSMKAPAWTIALEEIASWLIGLVLMSALLVAWQRGWGPARLFSNRAVWADGLRLRTLAAVHLRIDGVLALLLVPPILILACYMIYIAPQIEQWFRMHPGPKLGLFHGSVNTIRFVVSFWWLSGGLFAWLYWTPAARASYLVDVIEGGGNE